MLICEMRNTEGSLLNEEKFGNDVVNIELIKIDWYKLWKALAISFSRCLTENTMPSSWKESEFILLHKKDDEDDLKNHHLIYLLFRIHMLFVRNMNCLIRLIDEQ